MSDPDSTDSTDDTSTPPQAEAEWARRRRRAAVFGEGLPDVTSDERDPESAGSGEGESASDRWLKSQVPPHHG